MGKRKYCFIIALVILLELSFSAVSQAANAQKLATYFDYYNNSSDNSPAKETVTVSAENMTASENPSNATGVIENIISSQLTDDNLWCEWEFEVLNEGNFEVYIEYYPLKKTGKDILISMKIDGELPYAEAENLALSRMWKDEITTNDGSFEKGQNGDDLRPKQIEDPCWIEAPFTDTEGLYENPYIVALSSGKHTLRIELQRECLAISKITFGCGDDVPDYNTYIKEYENTEEQKNDTVYLQAEKALRKTSSVLYPTYDRADAATVPSDPQRLLLNTIGQSNWGKQGDTIFWQVNVPSSGLYKVDFRARQNYNQGMSSYRTLKVNGKVPFSEAENIAFYYDQDWYILTLGGDEPQYLYLEPGDIISLTCTSGEMSSILRNVRKGLLELNEIYREIISITSTEPDIYRSYSLDKQIPELESTLLSIGEFLNDTADAAEKINGTRGSQASILDYVSKIACQMAENPDTIPERLSAFKGAIDNLGSLVLSLGNQPLELDYMAFSGKETQPLKAKAGFFKQLSFSVKQFLFSFGSEYTMTESKDENEINVWVSTGRDQAQIISNLINNSFTKETGINIRLNMVDTGATLIKATLAGKGPDVALTLGVPLELACRDALVCLDDYDLSDIINQFYEQTLVPMKYEGRLYALPESQNFDVMFYRTDVFDDLGLKVPDTWDEFFSVMEKLQKKNLVVGIPEINSANMGVSDGIATFDKFLLQSGGSYYNEEQTEILFNTENAYNAFEKWVKLYQIYGLDREYNFYSRFRTGEMPLAIQNYTSYNQIVQAAPELQGLWTIAPIPGTADETGSIDRSESGNVIGCVMLKSAVKKGIDADALKFMKWWVDSKTQTEYAYELEATLGVAARYAAANREVMVNIGWSRDELTVLTEQMKWSKPIPQVPGNYLIPRSLTTAFRSVMSSQTSARQALTVCNININDELKRKREEFNLK